MSRLKSFIQYIIILGVTGLLLWLSLRGLQTTGDEDKTALLWRTWQQSDKKFLLLMAVVAIASHWLRAVRWKMLIEPTGHTVRTWPAFHSLMVGYLVNLGIPRGGEISRCYNLYKLENTPVETSIGTVVIERLIDVLCLFLLLAISFLVEWKNLMTFFGALGIGQSSTKIAIPVWIWLVLVVLLMGAIALYLLRKNERLIKIFIGFKNGLLAILRLKNPALFITYSILIWALYFTMTYTVMLAFQQTSVLGMGAALVVFAIGAIAMALPMPGGLGSYHTLMPLGLGMIYGIAKTDAIAFVFVFHAWQTLVMIIGGVISLIATAIILQKRKTENARKR
jgi:glycosyltransferase 2 family protein